MQKILTEGEALKNLTLLSDSFKEHINEIDLNMADYIKTSMKFGEVLKEENSYRTFKIIPKFLDGEVNFCGTSCCIIGYAGISKIPELKPLSSDKDWSYYSFRLFVPENFECLWDFLFGGFHINDKQQAVERMDFVIELLSQDYTFERINDVLFSVRYDDSNFLTYEYFDGEEDFKSFIKIARGKL